MMRKMKENRGFTLAELLIVVAIIAVLVAIAIPIFSSQLEKAREATDLANMRSAYAECSAAALTAPSTVTGYYKAVSPVQTDGATFNKIDTSGKIGPTLISSITACKAGADIYVNVAVDGTTTFTAAAESGFTACPAN